MDDISFSNYSFDDFPGPPLRACDQEHAGPPERLPDPGPPGPILQPVGAEAAVLVVYFPVGSPFREMFNDFATR